MNFSKLNSILNTPLIIKLLQFSIFILIVFFSKWLSGINDIPVSLDEIAWMNDSRVYEERNNKNWDYFKWQAHQPIGSWSSADFRLFDQPHLVKYIYGFALSNSNLYPWSGDLYDRNNQLFLRQSLPDDLSLGTLESKKMLGVEVDEALQISRKISVVFSLLFFIVLFLFLLNISSFIHSALTTFLLMNSQVFLYNLRVATSDSVSVLFVLCCVILVYKLFWNIENLSNKKSFLFTYLLAISSAFAASTKINGWFLIPLILVFFTIKAILSNHVSIYKNVVLQRFILFSLIFIGTYWYLQPELWNFGFSGLMRFFSQRVIQHQKFVFSFGSFNIFEFHPWIFGLVFNSSFFNSTLKQLVFLLGGLGGLLGVIFKNRNTMIFGKIVLISIWVWVSVFFYARVGFDRYGIWLVTLLVIFLAYGWTRLFYKIFGLVKKNINTLILKVVKL